MINDYFMVFNKTEQQEREYLEQVTRVIKEAIQGVDSSVKDHVDTLREYKDYLWSNKDIDPHEIRSMRESILNHFAIGESVIDKRARLEKILDIPYFGRVDFREYGAGAGVVPVYIGIHSFYDSRRKMNLIYDWRAPVSSMFYDYELGAASYDSPAGRTEGEISLKRQYRVRGGKMEYMIESSLAVHDDVLQRELSANADDKMKNIVATIQREQNRIIRDEEARVLVIQGVAGSGKTSIALHRVAYLLYAHKGEISSKDILIISPNKVFADYISNVLPELGEEAIPETSMELVLSGVLDHKYRYQTFFEQVAELLGRPTAGFIERVRYKSTFDFVAQLDRFILHVENTYFRPEDVKLTRLVTLPGEYVAEQFRRFHRYPMRQRFEVMTDYIVEEVGVRYRVRLTTAERNALRNKIRDMFAGNNDLQVYKDFFEWLGMPGMFKLRKNRTVEYSDLAPLAYLHVALEGQKSYSRVKHLLIDEMQDYSVVQYKVILKLFACKMTVLGDANQSVNPYGSLTSDMIRKALVAGEVMKLCKSYRSTCEITEFAQRIQANDELEVVERHGDKPRVLHFGSEEEEIGGIVELIAGFRLSGYKSLGIVCKDEGLAKGLYDRLKEREQEVHFLSSQSNAFIKGVVVTFAHMAKGLEFDEVIIPHVNSGTYKSDIDRGMLYVAATRAMHCLTLTYHGRRTGFVKC